MKQHDISVSMRWSADSRVCQLAFCSYSVVIPTHHKVQSKAAFDKAMLSKKAVKPTNQSPSRT